jgi:streptogramin lyase
VCSVLLLGALLLACAASAVAVPVGTITEFSKGISAKAEPIGVTAGPDGNLWFTEEGYETTPGAIGRMTPAGAVTEFRSGLGEFAAPQRITTGPEGNLWFTDAASRIGRITPAGVITEFSTGITPPGEPDGIVTGPEGTSGSPSATATASGG